MIICTHASNRTDVSAHIRILHHIAHSPDPSCAGYNVYIHSWSGSEPLTSQELRELCKEHGLSHVGKKGDMVERLVAFRGGEARTE